MPKEKKINSSTCNPRKSESGWRTAGKITLALGVTYHCIYPIVKINEQFAPWSKIRTQGRENILGEIKELRQVKGRSKSFIVTRDNHFHWRLNQSRLGIPHASLLSKIATGYQNIDHATRKASQLKTVFKYPSKNQLCIAILEAKPEIYVVPKSSLEDNCLSKKNSGYSFYKDVENGRRWKFTNTKIGAIHLRND